MTGEWVMALEQRADTSVAAGSAADVDQPYICLFKYDASGVHSAVKWMLGDTVINER